MYVPAAWADTQNLPWGRTYLAGRRRVLVDVSEERHSIVADCRRTHCFRVPPVTITTLHGKG